MEEIGYGGSRNRQPDKADDGSEILGASSSPEDHAAADGVGGGPPHDSREGMVGQGALSREPEKKKADRVSFGLLVEKLLN